MSLDKRVRHLFGGRCHLVHRLDRGASGITLVASDAREKAALHMALKSRDAKKVYFAICRGNGTFFFSRGSFLLDRPLRNVHAKRASMQLETREASTDVQVLFGGDSPACCLVRAEPRTGRFHQIRRHLRNISLPILGDSFGKSGVVREWEACGLTLPKRVLLHLHHVRLPVTEHTPSIDVRCPLPPDVQDVLRRSCSSWIGKATDALPALF